MERLRSAWLLALPLTVLAWLGAHELAYGLAFPAGHARTHALAASGHGYLELMPLLAAFCLTLSAAAFLARVAGRGGGPRMLPAWAFGALPLLGFGVQEHLERWLAGAAAWGTGLEPVFLIGLALQLPFGLAASLLARALLTTADELAAARSAPHRPRLRPAPFLAAATEADLVPEPVLASRRAGRAPPERL
jgi:hypothetical protein